MSHSSNLLFWVKILRDIIHHKTAMTEDETIHQKDMALRETSNQILSNDGFCYWDYIINTMEGRRNAYWQNVFLNNCKACFKFEIPQN